jgi:hypothetical protein
VTHYRNGRAFEHRVRAELEADGYRTQLAPGSKGPADIWAGKAGEWLFVSVKRTNGVIRPAERKALLDLAAWCYAPGKADTLAIVAFQPVPRKPIVYRQLTGIGPADWIPWTADRVIDKDGAA